MVPRIQYDTEIREQVVHDLYERGRMAILVSLILLVVIRWAIEPAYRVDARVRGLFVALIAVNLIRWAVVMVPARQRNALAGTRAQFILFAAGVAVSSSIFGLIIILTWPLLDMPRMAILTIITSGQVSGAVMSLGFSPLVYMLYLFPLVGTLFLMAITDQRPPWGAGILAASLLIFSIFVMLTSIDQRRTRRRAIELTLQLSDLVVRDTLTRLHNRRFLHEFMNVEEERLKRDVRDIALRDSAIALFIMDLDLFKQVNDTYGHATGDAVIRQTAEVLIEALRKSDVVVRWGGDEFVAIARVKQRDHPRVVAEKLNRVVEAAKYRLPDGQTLRATVSMGYCVMPFFPDQTRHLTWEQVFALADAALYLAKAEGRNRWVGVVCGDAPWADIPQSFNETVQDLRRACERGLVVLDR